MGDDWFVALRGEFIKPYFKEVGPLRKGNARRGLMGCRTVVVEEVCGGGAKVEKDLSTRRVL